ncbi:mannosyl-3-phosphoglycerate phosphatase-related protein [Candidatus Symbiopectobacterium sp. NZEC151]|uniref:mannosyl-3-phosphoglycerate phosphatase-related protein n=1 Tax=Candidatus Symbiopectobacterium sp. NZEC151 TaxID=2820470 RepID=UPI0022276A9B|nr:mannosyl-3-phosphoglycerate phosphatase-related protein [Candidatus Symbiopectobacterium sp. NZEC151]MCW2473863.1 mannosyl-3-phosphoglycerate phosphatase-related protein [Candidatus Symbiopectobacterium sp. NZEC151]
MPELGDDMLIFSDLDGSLLDHDTYDWQPAAHWLRRLRQHRIPVIITTSKTACETLLIRRELGLEHCPFIAENGASVALPEHWHTHADYPCKLFSAGYVEICAVLERLRLEQSFSFSGFSTLTDSDVATLTGLPLADAKRARQRQASEPLLWHDDDAALQRFIHLLDRHGLALTQGGRFYHVMGKGINKGRAASWLRLQYQQVTGTTPITLSLGDGPNDIALLQSTDYAVVIKSQSQQHITLGEAYTGKAYFTHDTGPTGWSEGLCHFISDNKKREVCDE